LAIVNNLFGVGGNKDPCIVTYLVSGWWRDPMDSDHMNDAVDTAIHMPILVFINGAIANSKEIREKLVRDQ
jgi:hypothetical protein